MLRMKVLISQTTILENLTDITDHRNYRILGFRNKVKELEHTYLGEQTKFDI